MLSYNEFTQKMKEEVQNRFGDGYEVLMHEVRKTNLGLTETLIILQKPEGENRISPQFYLRPMYQRYRNGTDMENLVEELICAYADSKEKAGNIMTDAGDIHDYERYRGRIYFRLINTEKNRILLEDVPHFEILDFSMVFYILISEEMDGVSSVMIQNNLLKKYEVYFNKSSLFELHDLMDEIWYRIEAIVREKDVRKDIGIYLISAHVFSKLIQTLFLKQFVRE